MTSGIAIGATPLEGGRYQRPVLSLSKGGSSLSLEKTRFAANAAAKESPHG